MIGVITAADASAARTVLGVDATGTDNSTDVTLATVTGNYLSLTDQEITVSTIPLSLGGTGATTATAARTALGLGTAATTDATAYATAAQGTTADNALQAANDLSDVADAATARTNLGFFTGSLQFSFLPGFTDQSGRTITFTGSPNVTATSKIFLNPVSDFNNGVGNTYEGTFYVTNINATSSTFDIKNTLSYNNTSASNFTINFHYIIINE